MPAGKIRGKSAILVNNSNVSNATKTSTGPTLLKIESVVPTISNRNHKLVKRSHSTLNPAYVKKLNETRKSANTRGPDEQNANQSNSGSSIYIQNGISHIKRTQKEKEKLSDRINLDRRGLTAIPFIDDEPNLRLLSLQHNLINIFHVPQLSIDESNGENINIEVPNNNNNNSSPSSIDNKLLNKNATSSNISSQFTISSSSSSSSIAAAGAATVNNFSKTALAATNLQHKQQLLLSQRSSTRNLLVGGSAGLLTTNKPTLGLNYTNVGGPFSSAINHINPFVQKSLLLNANQKNILKKSNSFVASQFMGGNNLVLVNKLMLEKSQQLKANHQMVSFSSDTLSISISENSGNLLTRPNIPLVTNDANFMAGFSISLQNLVFLDLYDNQIERISNLDGLKSLTVLLLGKNRIVDITGIISLKNTLRVLDLHGNKIASISQKICRLQELKSLNLAGNLLRHIANGDFAGLFNLKELNLKRNRIKRISGFDDLRNLERLWLCHNDLQKVEDMSCIAKAINLKEVTIENNPVSLAGDCVSFMVSYLPSLISLSQMQVTEQVRRAAMAWRKSKETSDANYVNLSSDVGQSIRREEVISNARTNWELLRSQQTVSNNKSPINTQQKVITSNVSPNPNQIPSKEIEIDAQSTISDSLTSTKKVLKQKTVATSKRDKKMIRSSSQEPDFDVKSTDNIAEEFFRLPPILAPFLDQNYQSQKTNSSGSSLGPNIDSCSSYYSSDNEDRNNENKQVKGKRRSKSNQREARDFTDCDDKNDKEVLNELMKIDNDENDKSPKNDTVVDQRIETIVIDPPIINYPEEKNLANIELKKTDNKEISEDLVQDTIPKPYSEIIFEKPSLTENVIQADNKSNLSTTSIKTGSESSVVTNSSDEPRSQKIRSANQNRKYFTGSLVRAQTARGNPNTTNSNTGNSNNTVNISLKPHKNQTEREREQGGDYLIEICGRYLNVYGTGALKFIDKQWNIQKANDVHTVKFSYINFNCISGILNRIKVRFPNAENLIFRETNINCLGQLNALAEVQGINSLVIDPEGNVICSKNWRSYAIYRLSHWGLKQINGAEVTEEEIQTAETAYSGLSDLVLWSLPESLLTPLLTRLRLDETCLASKKSAKDWLMQADSSLKSVVGKEALQWRRNNTTFQEETTVRQKGRLYFSIMMENTCNAVEKLQKLETLWPLMLVEMIRNTLLDYSQIDVYVKNLMSEILKQ